MANELTKTGFVFKDQGGTVYLGLFEDGSVSEFNEISDWDEIYGDLMTTKIMVVDVKFGQTGSFSINDLYRLEIGQPDESGEFIPSDVVDMLEDLSFPSDDANNMFGSFLKESGKAN